MPSAVSGSERKTASVVAAWTTGRMPEGTATITSPAPMRPAARAISEAAPVISRDPATTTSTPDARLCESASRTGSHARTSDGSVTKTFVCTRASGNPMSTTRSAPARSAPGMSTAPTFAAPNVTVRSLLTASPSTAPVLPSTPEGMSTATTGGGPRVEPGDGRGPAVLGNPAEPRAEDRVDRDVGARQFALKPHGRARANPDAHLRKPLPVRRGRFVQTLRGLDAQHAHRDAPPRQMPGGHEPVPAVVPLAADHHGAPAVRAAAEVGHRARHRAAGPLHEHLARHAARLRLTVQLHGLLRRQDRLHAERSSCTATANATAFVFSCVKVMRIFVMPSASARRFAFPFNTIRGRRTDGARC